LLQSEENALNEQVAGQNLKINESSQESTLVEKNSVSDILFSKLNERKP